MSPFTTHPARSHTWLPLWLLILAFCLLLAELGHLFRFLNPEVLADLYPRAAAWWTRPAGLHWLAAVLLVVGGIVAGKSFLAGRDLPPTRWGRILAAVVVLLGAWICVNQFGEMVRVVTQPTDFGTIHHATTALRQGGDPYAATGNGYFYPPFLALLLAPLSWLPAAGASLLFFTVKAVMVAWTLTAARELTGGGDFGGNRSVLYVFGLIFVGARFWMADLQYGNTNSIIMCLVIASVLWDRRDRWPLAGVALAVAVSIKILPGVLALHFLARGRWRTLAAFAAAMLVLNLGPFLWMDEVWSGAWRAYLDAGVTGKLSERLAQPDNQSLWGLLNRGFPAAPLAGLRWVWAGSSLILLALAGRVSLATRGDSGVPAAAAAAVYPLLGLMISPGSWVVHYTAVLLPMAALWSLALQERWPGPVPWILFGVANLAFTVSGWARLTVRASIEQSWFVTTALLLIFGLGFWAWKTTRPRRSGGGFVK